MYGLSLLFIGSIILRAMKKDRSVFFSSNVSTRARKTALFVAAFGLPFFAHVSRNSLPSWDEKLQIVSSFNFFSQMTSLRHDALVAAVACTDESVDGPGHGCVRACPKVLLEVDLSSGARPAQPPRIDICKKRLIL